VDIDDFISLKQIAHQFTDRLMLNLHTKMVKDYPKCKSDNINGNNCAV